MNLRTRVFIRLICALAAVLVFAIPTRLYAAENQLMVAVDSKFASQIVTIDDPHGKGALVINNSGITVDLNGWQLRSTEQDMSKMIGIGIYAKGVKDVTIRGGNIGGYKWGIFLEDCENIVIEDTIVESSRMQHTVSTDDKYDTSDWLNQWSVDGFEVYGGAVYLKNCKNSTVRGVVAEFQQNGVSLTDCQNIIVEGCQLSYNNGWGIHMWNADNCKIRRNVAEFCQRLEFWEYSAGGDSAGILVGNDSCFNTIEDNSFAHGGDSFFLCGQRPWLKASNFNIVRRNDCRFSPHNGIEATFSRGNRFIDNDVSHSRYGFWLGYSYETIVEGNTIAGCIEDGIAIEHGNSNVIKGNEFSNGKVGIRIFMRPMPDWVGNDPSYDYVVSDNVFKNVRKGVIVEETENVVVSGNHFKKCKEAIYAKLVKNIAISRNNIRNGWLGINIVESSNVSIDDNKIIHCNEPKRIDEKTKNVIGD